MYLSRKELEFSVKDLKVCLFNSRVQAQVKEIALNERIDTLESQLKARVPCEEMLAKEISRLTGECERLRAENLGLRTDNAALKDTVAALTDQRDKYRAIAAKDSTNSSKPPSSDGLKKKHRDLSTRKKSGKKVGGQPRHPGHTLKALAPTKTVNRMPDARCECGGHITCVPGYLPKQRIDIVIGVEVIEERSYSGVCDCCGKRHAGAFSAGFVNPVCYGNNINALTTFLNCYANVPMNKVAETITNLTAGAVHMSDGTVANIIKRMSDAADATVAYIKERLITCKVLGADETGCRVAGSLDWAQIYSNVGYTLFGHGKSRGNLCNEELGILGLFSGILVHDHFKSYYTYKHLTHAECNAHILRYLKSVLEILGHEWAKDMTELLIEANNLKKAHIKADKDALDASASDNISRRYDECLAAGKKQYDSAIDGKSNITYYDDERKLLARLEQYKNEHLRFITDFSAPFDNNTSERDARMFKGKLKVAGCFRSDQGADDYAKLASVIATARKQNTNVFDALRDILDGAMPQFAIQQAVPDG